MVKGTFNVSAKGTEEAVKKAIEGISKLQVYVGIPEETAGRNEDDPELNNAQLAFLHTHGVRSREMREDMKPEMDKGTPYSMAHALYIESHGSPAYNVPPRPIIEPAIEAEDNKEMIAKQLARAASEAIDGKPGETRASLHRAGLTAQNAVRDWFEDPRNNWPANTPATIKKKGSDRPLVDTGELRKAITYVVVEHD